MSSDLFTEFELRSLRALIAVAENPELSARERRLAASKVLDACTILRSPTSEAAPANPSAPAAPASSPAASATLLDRIASLAGPAADSPSTSLAASLFAAAGTPFTLPRPISPAPPVLRQLSAELPRAA